MDFSCIFSRSNKPPKNRGVLGSKFMTRLVYVTASSKMCLKRILYFKHKNDRTVLGPVLMDSVVIQLVKISIPRFFVYWLTPFELGDRSV